MPFAIDTAQRRYFHEENWIELEEALLPNDFARLQSLWSVRISGITVPAILYDKGRELRLSDSRLDRLAMNLSQLVAGLWNERPLYIALDQVLTPVDIASWDLLKKLPSDKALEALFSVSGYLGALAISLSPPVEPLLKKEDTQEEVLLGSTPGSVLIFKAGEMPVFEKLDPKQSWWIIVYGSEAMRYSPKNTDPLKEFFRNKGAAVSGKLTQAKVTCIAK